MAKGQSLMLPLRAAYEFGIARGLQEEIDEIRRLRIEWDLSYDSSLRRALIVELFNEKGIFDDFIKECWPPGGTPRANTKLAFYKSIKQRFDAFLENGSADALEDVEDDYDGVDSDLEAEQQFAAEKDLRDFLAKNPQVIESGMRLYEVNGKTGVEFPIESGFIDLLLKDRNDKFVVVELKVGRGRNKAIGQLLYYMGWIDQNLSKEQCRGMIIAKEVSEEMKIACKRVSGVSLHSYSLSVSITAA